MATMSLIAMERRLNSKGISLFDYAPIPEKFDKDLLINAILRRCGAHEVVQADPDWLASDIGIWFSEWRETFDRWWDLKHLDYNPIENYDRIEESTISGESNSTTSQNGTTSNANSTTSQNYVSAFDSLSLTTKDQTSNKGSDNGSTSINGNTANTNEQTTTSRIHGNIGVTTSAQMISSELELARKNLYVMIADMFAHEFLLMIY